MLLYSHLISIKVKSAPIHLHGHKHTRLLMLTLLLCLLPFPFLSCTAPDKQHQKQHSHQPQRKRPFTCSGIYPPNPSSPVYVSVSFPIACSSLKAPRFTRPSSSILRLVSVFPLSACQSWVIFAELLLWPQRLVRS